MGVEELLVQSRRLGQLTLDGASDWARGADGGGGWRRSPGTAASATTPATGRGRGLSGWGSGGGRSPLLLLLLLLLENTGRCLGGDADGSPASNPAGEVASAGRIVPLLASCLFLLGGQEELPLGGGGDGDPSALLHLQLSGLEVPDLVELLPGVPARLGHLDQLVAGVHHPRALLGEDGLAGVCHSARPNAAPPGPLSPERPSSSTPSCAPCPSTSPASSSSLGQHLHHGPVDRHLRRRKCRSRTNPCSYNPVSGSDLEDPDGPGGGAAPQGRNQTKESPNQINAFGLCGICARCDLFLLRRNIITRSILN